MDVHKRQKERVIEKKNKKKQRVMLSKLAARIKSDTYLHVRQKFNIKILHTFLISILVLLLV